MKITRSYIFLWAVMSLAAAANAQGEPLITTQPQDQTNYVGATATFTVTAIGTESVSYQWQKYSTNFADIPNSTEASLTLTNLQTDDAADYRVVVTDASNSTNIATAHLYVSPPETLFISQSAASTATFSWNGNMVLVEAIMPESGSLNCALRLPAPTLNPTTLYIQS